MIQFITHSNERYGYVDGARMALEGGCRWNQLRMKDASEADFLSAAKEISKLCKQHNAVFVLDDHAEWVEQTGADGVHLGKNDMPVDEARRPSKTWSVCTDKVPTTLVAVPSASPLRRRICRRYWDWKAIVTL